MSNVDPVSLTICLGFLSIMAVTAVLVTFFDKDR